jgi:GTP-binding protein
MKIQQVEFVISAVQPSQYPDEVLPEIALAGRSNVGKSSLINQIIGRKQLARTSSKPGKTQTLNFYLINQAFYLVDLPGYGYAKVSKAKRQQWGSFIEKYILERKALKLMLLLIDFRHPPSKDDQVMYNWLTYYQIPVVVVATKTDKVPKSQKIKHENIIREQLNMLEHTPICLFSSTDVQMKDFYTEQLWAVIEQKIYQANSNV